MSFPIKTGLTLALGGLGLVLMPQTVVNLASQATSFISQVA
jgi:hypothetical protein